MLERWTVMASVAAMAAMVTIGGGEAVAGCGCAKPPPSLQLVRPAFASPGDTVTFMYCPLRDGRPGGAIGWARLEDGRYVNPADGGCAGNEQSIERWKGWLEKGYTSKADAEKAAQ